MRNKIKALLLSLAFVLIAPALHAQAVVTFSWTNTAPPANEVISGFILLRAPCTGTVTGTTGASGATTGKCSVVPPQSSFVNYFENDNGTTTPKCTPTAQLNGCVVDNLNPGDSFAYEIELIATCATCTAQKTATSTPGGLVSAAFPKAVVVPVVVAPAPISNLTAK